MASQSSASVSDVESVGRNKCEQVEAIANFRVEEMDELNRLCHRIIVEVNK